MSIKIFFLTHYSRVLILLISFLFFNKSFGQTSQHSLEATILHKDSLFWKSYNNCDVQKFSEFFTDDLEFYHDKGGITNGLENLATSMKKNLCSDANFRLRREEVAGTVKVYPLQKSKEIYGAIISGSHVFYTNEKGKKERLDGLARFTHIWILKDNSWKMTRILSYDHGPAPQSK
ncbi:MAG: nuclear transport factor 2 family protein [Chitinophagaceae bacterium]